MEELRRKLLNDKNQALDSLRDRLIKVYFLLIPWSYPLKELFEFKLIRIPIILSWMLNEKSRMFTLSLVTLLFSLCMSFFLPSVLKLYQLSL